MPKEDPSRKLRTGKELQNAAVHVAYEVEMLIFAAQHLRGWHSSPRTMPAGAEKNMALECFLLHFRNLRAFLCPSVQPCHADDVLASDFLGISCAIDFGAATKLGVNKERLNKMLAHLSYHRDDFIEAGDCAWNTTDMLVVLLSELRRFLALLSPELSAWFPSAAKLAECQSLAEAFASKGE